MNVENLNKFLIENNQPTYRARQIQKAIFQEGIANFSEISTISKDLRELLAKKIQLLSFEVKKIASSKNKLAIKALLILKDGLIIETVLLQAMPGRWSVCISSQSGCPLRCVFCATGKLGFGRNLTEEEISDQVLFWKQYLKLNFLPDDKISNIIYMGMGEPFLNWEMVRKSLIILTDKDLFAFGSRSISISTVGISEGIEKLAEEFPQINLALSLHFANDKKRNQYMPINQKHNLADLKKTLQTYFSKTNRQVFIEYVMLSGINDNEKDACELATYLKSFGRRQLVHINLISYNQTGGEFMATSGNKMQLFKQYLKNNGLSVTIRKSLGGDVCGACGQLAGKC